jgi:hypothetical protein
MKWGNFTLLAGLAWFSGTATTAAAQDTSPAAGDPAAAIKSLAQNCDAHKFETTVQVIGPDGRPKASKVKMCGTEGQTDADWIRTLEDAVKKTAESPQMPRTAKEQIVAAVNLEIQRLSQPTLQLSPGTDIASLPKAKPAMPVTSEAPLSRDFGALPPLPTASTVAPPHVLGPGGTMGAVPRLTLRCALAGDEDRPSDCDTIDRDTVLVVRADDAYPRGVAMRFVRHGNSRAETDLPALKPGQTASLRVPAAVCAGVVRSKVEIQALAANSPNGTPAGTIGEYDLRC